jgi:hypothetical protein
VTEVTEPIPPRSDTLSVTEVSLMERLYDEGSDRAHYLKGHDLRRARRLLELDMTVQGRLGDRYFGLTPKGRAFVEGIRARRGGNDR